MRLDYSLTDLQFDLDLPWKLFFQDSGSPQMETIEELHNNIIFYLVIILITVTWMMLIVIRDFVDTKFSIAYKYMNHGRLIKLIWTIAPTLILILIGFISFVSLYLMDEVMDPSLVVYKEGHQWYWSFQYLDPTKVYYKYIDTDVSLFFLSERFPLGSGPLGPYLGPSGPSGGWPSAGGPSSGGPLVPISFRERELARTLELTLPERPYPNHSNLIGGRYDEYKVRSVSIVDRISPLFFEKVIFEHSNSAGRVFPEVFHYTLPEIKDFGLRRVYYEHSVYYEYNFNDANNRHCCVTYPDGSKIYYVPDNAGDLSKYLRSRNISIEAERIQQAERVRTRGLLSINNLISSDNIDPREANRRR